MQPLILGLAAATFVSTMTGGLLMLRFRNSPHYFFAFAAGSIITVALLDLLPEGLSIASRNGVHARVILGVVVASFFFYSFIAKLFLTHHLHDDDTHGHPLGPIGAGSLVVHSFFDGVAIGAAYQAGAALGLIVATAVIAHDMVDGLNTVVLMLKNHHGARRALGFLVADAAAPLAGVLAASLVRIPEVALAVLLSFFVGEFLFIGASTLLPETQNHGSLKTMAAMALGVALIAVLTSLVA